ncbi:T9SS type A sorting domain-containing protein [Polaribacter sp. PL03]|uniref:T9SS type A sorting domain-containing protein n=1 Tax=Polaribacter sp. PL03 TaxID=3088353 RepID=UPI0029CD0865|nr:T9SS type A sorting domain-containing protein [Polaribacter sp. PL03]MDX6748155.1 T9SS type A sorting domain-containing protein [Polaribacter sp. PL03]
MKKTILTIATILITFLSYSQITLEKTIEKNEKINFVKIDDDMKYFIFDLNTLVMKIYNSNHSIYKNITIDTNNLGFSYDVNDYYFSEYFPVIGLSKNIFDTDSELEFLFTLYGNNSNTKTLVVNEDGTIISNIPNKVGLYRSDIDTQNPTWIKNTGSGIKMILRDVNSSDNKKYIYSLPGNATLSSAKTNLNNIKLNAYPNPSNGFINLDYKLPENIKNGKILVYNLNGIKVKEYKVDNHVNSLKLNNENLSSGTYIYSIIAGNYKSKPLKLIIK